MRISIIDIGTNTVLLLVADVNAGGAVIPVHHAHEIARLGKGVDASGSITDDAVERVERVLKEFCSIAANQRSERVIACGTSALRDASNRSDVLAHFKKNSGLDVQILSGDDEAELTYLGAVQEFLGKSDNSEYAVLDIGGGSTEITFGTGLAVTSRKSMDIGCVRLTERFLSAFPPSSLSMGEAVKVIREHIRSIPPMNDQTQLIGVAGTLTTLGAIDLHMTTYDPLKVSGHVLRRETIVDILNRLRLKSIEQLKEVPQILPGRADILLAGILILLESMDQLETSEVLVSDRGLRYGVAMKEGMKKAS